jgi:hypothetical protein
MSFDEETVRRLLENDPSLEVIDWSQPSAAALADAELGRRLTMALHFSSHVRHLIFSFDMFDDIATQLQNGTVTDLNGTALMYYVFARMDQRWRIFELPFDFPQPRHKCHGVCSPQ